MGLLFGFSLVLAAGLLQGTFILPMTLTKRWEWEHTWATYSLFAMLVFNWILTLIFIPNILSIYSLVSPNDIIIVGLFGLGWSIGSILFGLGMDRLGMSLGYPIIMGLVASLGALIPLAVFFPETLFAAKGLVILSGTVIVVLGIVIISVAGSRKQPGSESSDTAKSGSFAAGLIIAISSGVLSCSANLAIAFSGNIINQAKALGISDASAGNAAWALVFTIGFIVNFGYCLFLMIKRGNLKDYFVSETKGNIGLSSLMAIMWTGSFYLYGMSAVKLGKLGVVVGWPIFMSLIIIVGNLWGIRRGEWKDAPKSARSLLNRGLAVLLIAVVIIAASNLL